MPALASLGHWHWRCLSQCAGYYLFSFAAPRRLPRGTVRENRMCARNIVACVLFALPISHGIQSYRSFGGYVPVGNDVSALPSGTTLAVAQSACNAAPECVAFTFAGVSLPAGTVYLKNATGWAEFVANSTVPWAWSTYWKVEGPCDIFLAGGTPCVGAFSVVRALYGNASGPLYQLNRTDTSSVLDVFPTVTGTADTAAHEAFCSGAPASCVFNAIYDQSPQRNHLAIATRDGYVDDPVNAMAKPITVGGERAYGAMFVGNQGYRRDNTTGVAKNNDPETLYMVHDGTHFNDKCCLCVCIQTLRGQIAEQLTPFPCHFLLSQ